MTIKKGQKWSPGVLPRSLPRPPGDLLGGSRWPKAPPSPRAAKTAPSAAQERFRPAQAPPRSASGAASPLGARFYTLRGPLFEASAAECAAFRGALAIAPRPFHSTAPEVKKVRECQNHNPPKRPPKQSLAPKPLANKGARRCGRSHRQYTYTLSQKKWTQ